MLRLEFTGELIGLRQYSDKVDSPDFSLVFLCDGGASGDTENNVLFYTKASKEALEPLNFIAPGLRYRVVCNDVGISYWFDQETFEMDHAVTYVVAEMSKIS